MTAEKNCGTIAYIDHGGRKAMFRNLLNPDNALMVTMSRVTDCIFLSMFWLLGCIPVVTVGASFAALYDATFRGFRQGEKNSWRRFFRVFGDNWKVGIAPSLVFFGVLALLMKAGIALWNAVATLQISWMVFSAGMVLLVFALGLVSYLFPVLSRFDNSFPALLRNTVLLALANMPRTLALGVVNVVSGFLCYRFLYPIFVVPALAALIGSLLIEPAIRPYMPQEEAAD